VTGGLLRMPVATRQRACASVVWPRVIWLAPTHPAKIAEAGWRPRARAQAHPHRCRHRRGRPVVPAGLLGMPGSVLLSRADVLSPSAPAQASRIALVVQHVGGRVTVVGRVKDVRGDQVSLEGPCGGDICVDRTGVQPWNTEFVQVPSRAPATGRPCWCRSCLYARTCSALPLTNRGARAQIVGTVQADRTVVEERSSEFGNDLDLKLYNEMVLLGKSSL
jgi:hypothetical protein